MQLSYQINRYYLRLSLKDYRLGLPYRPWASLRKEKLEKFEPMDSIDITLTLLFFAFDSYYIIFNLFFLVNYKLFIQKLALKKIY